MSKEPVANTATPTKPAATVAKPAMAKALPVQAAAPTAAPRQQAMAAKSQQAVAEPDDEGEEAFEEAGTSHRFLLFFAVPSWMVSGVVHGIALIVLALLTITEPIKKTYEIVSGNMDKVDEIQDFKDDLIQPIDVNASTSTDVTTPSSVSSDVVVETPDVSVSNDLDSAAIHVELSDFGQQTAPRNDLMKTVGSVSGSGLEGRGSAAARTAMARASGGSSESEAAVAEALKWLAAHQGQDGGWNFDHRVGSCNGRCRDAGKMAGARNGATGMALLPFLGSGQTHKQGAYQKQVGAGLYFLAHQMKNNKAGGGDLADGGNMYSHGICAIVLCEAYAMTHDRDLMLPAQAAINHIVYAQDPVGGGWRYSPKQAGDTSAVGWQLMALKSGHMAYLTVPPATVLGATKFLDSVQADSGSKYGYTGPGAGQATTAVGLLCRMYLGWKKDNPGLQRGVQYLSTTGPSKSNMYYNYYATQIMRHNEGEEWKKWNKEMHDWLVGSQAKEGHEKGSWFMGGGDHGADAGGRLYCTSMATMILEVYYRHMPIYGKAASEEDFPL